MRTEVRCETGRNMHNGEAYTVLCVLLKPYVNLIKIKCATGTAVGATALLRRYGFTIRFSDRDSHFSTMIVRYRDLSDITSVIYLYSLYACVYM